MKENEINNVELETGKLIKLLNKKIVLIVDDTRMYWQLNDNGNFSLKFSFTRGLRIDKRKANKIFVKVFKLLGVRLHFLKIDRLCISRFHITPDEALKLKKINNKLEIILEKYTRSLHESDDEDKFDSNVESQHETDRNKDYKIGYKYIIRPTIIEPFQPYVDLYHTHISHKEILEYLKTKNNGIIIRKSSEKDSLTISWYDNGKAKNFRIRISSSKEDIEICISNIFKSFGSNYDEITKKEILQVKNQDYSFKTISEINKYENLVNNFISKLEEEKIRITILPENGNTLYTNRLPKEIIDTIIAMGAFSTTNKNQKNTQFDAKVAIEEIKENEAVSRKRQENHSVKNN